MKSGKVIVSQIVPNPFAAFPTSPPCLRKFLFLRGASDLDKIQEFIQWLFLVTQIERNKT